jgi:CBS domain-containing protein
VDAGGLLLGILTVDDLLDLLAEGMVELVRLVTREQRREQHERP